MNRTAFIGTNLDSEDNKKWTLLEIIEECKEVIKQLKEVEND